MNQNERIQGENHGREQYSISLHYNYYYYGKGFASGYLYSDTRPCVVITLAKLYPLEEGGISYGH